MSNEKFCISFGCDDKAAGNAKSVHLLQDLVVSVQKHNLSSIIILQI